MRPSSSPALWGAGAMVVCAFLWSSAGLFIKLIDWGPLWIAGLRSLVAGAFLAGVVALRSGSLFRLRLSGPVLGAALANALCMLLFVTANKLTTSANAILIQYWSPVATALLGLIVLKEAIHKEQVVALVATLAGLVLLFAEKLGPGALWGNLAAFGSGLAFALMFLFTRMQKEGDPLVSLMLSHGVCAVLALGAAGLTSAPPVFTEASVAALLALGIGQIGLAALFFSYGIRRVSATTANLLAVVEPVFNPVWVMLVLGEAPTPLVLAGGALILVSVTAASVVSARRAAQPPR